MDDIGQKSSSRTEPTGYTAVPRWWRATPKWRRLKAVHRAVIDELFHRIARVPVEHWVTGTQLQRGQWIISVKDLAEASGATEKVTRVALERAEENDWIRQTVITASTPKGTIRISLFTWLQFETYDKPNDDEGKPEGGSPGKSNGNPKGKRKGNRIPDLNTLSEDPDLNTPAAAARHQRTGGEIERKDPAIKSGEALAGLPTIPDSLNTPQFNATWREFAQYRLQLGKTKKLTAIGAARMLNELLPLGPQEAVSRMNKAMTNGWMGVVFDDKNQRSSYGNATRRIEENLAL